MPEAYAPATTRPLLQTSRYAVAAGHYLASAAGVRILQRGGNAIDAGVAAGICINVLQPDMTNFGGVAPIAIYLAATGEVLTISGLGRWPKRVRPDYFRDVAGGTIPDDVTNAIVPSACDAWLTALARYGRLTLTEVLQPALELTMDGYPVNAFLAHNLLGCHTNLAQWPSSADYLRPDGSPLQVGDVLRQPVLAATFQTLIDTERSAASRGRAAAIMAARDRFYKGDLAERMARFSQEQGGFLDFDDLADFSVRVEPPARTTYRGYEVCLCGPWCQGPVTAQTLNVLEQFDVAAMGPGSPDYLHTLAEALKLSFADRHAFYGDPDVVAVPLAGLLSKEYARQRAAQISTRATPAMPSPGDPWSYGVAPVTAQTAARSGAFASDTSYLCVVDSEGNGFSATPSDGVRKSPIVPGVGVVLSPRGCQSWLDPSHPNVVAPGKRPTLTPNPALMLKDGRLAMAFGTPGGDVQPQAMTQLIVNVVDFGLDPQAAIEAPRVASESFPDSFDPHHYNPGVLRAEARFPKETLEALEQRGHIVKPWPAYTSSAGALCAIFVDGVWGPRAAGADPRRVAYAEGW